MIAIGIMQGRLSPPPPGRPQAFPTATWRREFADAAACGFTCLEWLVSEAGLDRNPLFSDAGVREIRALVDVSGVRVHSICLDYFVTAPLVPGDAGFGERRALLEQMIARAPQIGASVVALPLIERGAVGLGDALALLRELQPAWSLALSAGIRVALETDLDAMTLASLIDRAGEPALGVCYDLGNATARGAAVADEVRLLGSRVCAVHIKDRRIGGSTQPLGQGDADVDAFLDALSAIGYDAPLILETPVGHDAMASARANLAFVQQRTHPRLTR